MKLKDLKKAFSRFPSDMDDVEIMIQIARNGKEQTEPLCFVGFMPIPEHEFLVVGGLTAFQKLVKEGKAEKPKGYIEPEDSDKYIFGENHEND